MKKFLNAVAVSTLVALMVPSSSQAAGLSGSEWGTEQSVEQFIQFRIEDQVSGSGGCNNFFGSYSIKASADGNSGKLQFGPLASTRKACAEPVMKAEFEFLENLSKVHSYKRSKLHLELFDEKSKRVMRLRWRDFD